MTLAAGIVLIDGWWGHQPWRPRTPTMATKDNNHAVS
jgi:hypothetical protein